MCHEWWIILLLVIWLTVFYPAITLAVDRALNVKQLCLPLSRLYMLTYNDCVKKGDGKISVLSFFLQHADEGFGVVLRRRHHHTTQAMHRILKWGGENSENFT